MPANINDAFSVKGIYHLKGGNQIAFEIPASAFFDEGGDYIDSETWNCVMPWEKNSLIEYIDSTDRNAIEHLIVDIADHVHGIHRRIKEYYWDGHKLILDFKDFSNSPQTFLVILELSESTVDTKQLIRIQMSGDSSHVESHMRLWGKFPNEEYHLFRPLPK